MIFYYLYQISYFIALSLPRKAGYRFACVIADIHYFLSKKDRTAILKNLEIVMSGSQEKERREISRQVFRNFAKYLVDFFRFEKIDKRFIERYVKVEGKDNVTEALARGKGAIILSAHIGNWELGGFTVNALGFPLSAVVLVHQNKKIDDFFTRQRSFGRMGVIPVGSRLKECFLCLRKNGCLAILGDRDFSTAGVMVEFFGKKTVIPTGPAKISMETGCAIVPTFIVREPDDSFRMYFEKPIFPDSGSRKDPEAVTRYIRQYLASIEKCVREYPSQWYMFKEVWNGEKRNNLRPDTVI